MYSVGELLRRDIGATLSQFIGRGEEHLPLARFHAVVPSYTTLRRPSSGLRSWRIARRVTTFSGS